MENVPGQEPRMVDDKWQYTRREPQNDSSLKFESDTPMIDETIAIVKEKVWSFRAALKAAAEALVGFGLSPTVVGYSTVPLGEDEELAEKNEGEAALQKVINDEMLSRSMKSNRSDDNVRKRREEMRLVYQEEYKDDTNHSFVEAVHKEKDEKRSLTGAWEGDTLDEDEDESRKNK